MYKAIINTIIFGGAISYGSSVIHAQTFGLEYTTEWQTDFSGGYDWLNLLKTSAELPIGEVFSLQGSTISVAKTADYVLIEDLLTYSNIEAGNIPLTLAKLGLGISLCDANIFLGIYNVNEDFFTSELTSFFINSSYGISPTISCNFDIANYPLASWCLHYAQTIGDAAFQTSLYPGKGYSRLLGHDNLFKLDFKHDGIFSISSFDYKLHDIYFVLGVALHYGMCLGDVDGEQEQKEASATSKSLSTSPWILTEFHLPCNLNILAHTSFSNVKHGCKSYAGIGMIYDGSRLKPGIACNYASFTDASELAFEVSCRIPIKDDMIFMQPTLHLVNTDHSGLKSVGMLRLNISI